MVDSSLVCDSEVGTSGFTSESAIFDGDDMVIREMKDIRSVVIALP